MNRAAWRNRKARGIDEPAVNLTPLIDVVFVILIMFILVAPLLEIDRVDLASAASASEQKIDIKENGPITIYVEKNNVVLLNKRKVSLQELPSLLKQLKNTHPKARPQLYHDKQAHFGTYQSIKNAAELAGFDQLDIILKPG